MKLLVTGGAGFIGSNFVHLTLATRPDVQICVLDALTYAGSTASLDGVADRITFVEGDARELGWPDGNDLVLMSYLLSAVSEASAHDLLRKAGKALRPGGRLLVHDFMVDDDETGPPLAALWLLNAVTIDSDVAGLTPAWLSAAAARAGFEDTQLTPVVPGTTRLLTARR
jgi:ubiquinone/menaquinone biosynthesis C-methylase UbiE